VNPGGELASFFGAMSEMLLGHRTAAEVEREVGPSPSGTRRLGFYAVLAKRTRWLELKDLCPALRHAVTRAEPGLWREICAAYAEAHPPRHFDPNRFGEVLPEFLAARRPDDPRLKPYFEELADFEVSQWRVGMAVVSPADPVGMGRRLIVRQYEHDVPRFVERYHAGDPLDGPEPSPTLVLLYRDPTTGMARTFFPTPLALLVLARRAGSAVGHLPQASEADARVVEAELERYGVLPASASQ